jgi:hypothetical protein
MALLNSTVAYVQRAVIPSFATVVWFFVDWTRQLTNGTMLQIGCVLRGALVCWATQAFNITRHSVRRRWSILQCCAIAKPGVVARNLLATGTAEGERAWKVPRLARFCL